MNFLGTFANLSGMKVGRFTVEELAGRWHGEPLWRVVCNACSFPQTLPHYKIAPLVPGRHSQISLVCANPTCPLAHHESQSETIDEFRRRERKEAEQAARATAEAKRAAETKSEKVRKQAARDAQVQRQYICYVNSQWRAGQDDDRICSRRRWFELTDGTRQTILDIIEKDPTARIGGL